jgi:hypothetical protein
MRFIYNLGFLIILIGLPSCEKSEFRQDLTGTWEIFRSGGGIAGQGASYDFNLMRLDQKNRYQFTRNDTLIEKGTFMVVTYEQELSIPNAHYEIEFEPKYKLGNGVNQITSGSKIVQMISNDTIGLTDGFLDGFIYYFERLNE